MAVKQAVKDRAPSVSDAEASQIALRIVNAALAPPQITPLAKVISNAYILDGTDIPASKCLQIVRMASNAYTEIRQSPGFFNYLAYIKSNSHKIDGHKAIGQTDPEQRQSALDKISAILQKYRKDPDGQMAIATAQQLGQLVAKDAKIPPTQLPAFLRPAGSSPEVVQSTAVVPPNSPVLTKVQEGSGSGATETVTEYESTRVLTETFSIVKTSVVKKEQSTVLTFTADWMVTKTIDFTDFITDVETKLETDTIDYTRIDTWTRYDNVTDYLSITETVYKIGFITLTTEVTRVSGEEDYTTPTVTVTATEEITETPTPIATTVIAAVTVTATKFDKETLFETRTVTDQETQKVTDKVTERPTERAADRLPEKTTGNPSERMTEKPTETSAETPADKLTGKLSEKSNGKTANPTDKVSDKVSEKSEKETSSDVSASKSAKRRVRIVRVHPKKPGDEKEESKTTSKK